MLSKTQWLIIGGISIVVVGVITFMLLKTKNNLNVSKPKLKNKNPKKILIAGDSQSAIKTASGKNITFTYPNILMKNLPNVKIDVLAIGGKTSAWLLQNLPNQLKKERNNKHLD